MSPRRLLLVLLVASLPILFAGNEELNANDAAVATIPADALAFMDIKVGELWNSPAGKKLQADKGAAEFLNHCAQTFGTPIAQIDRLTFVVRSLEERRLTIVATTGPIAQDKVLVARFHILAALVPEHERQQHNERTYYVSKATRGPAVHFLDDRRYVFGPVAAVRGYVERPVAGKNDGPLAPALALTAGKHHLVAGLALNEKLVREWEEQLRKGREHDPIAKTLIQGVELVRPLLAVQTATLTADFGEETDVQLRMTFPDENLAEKGAAAAREGVDLLRLVANVLIADVANQPDAEESRSRLRQVETALENARIDRQSKIVDMSLKAKVDLATLVAAIGGATSSRPQISRRQSQRNLMQIGMAMHNYHNDYNSLPPPAIFDKDGKPLLSWRVAILPYIEQDNLYREFKLDEAWDSPHNKELLRRMPKTYGPAGLVDEQPVGTYYQVFAGKGTMFEGPKGLTLTQITNEDGTSNTLMIAEAGEPVPWTKPADLMYDDTKPLPKLGGLFPDGFHAAFGDRSVRFVKNAIDEKTLRALIGYNDGLAVNFEKFLK